MAVDPMIQVVEDDLVTCHIITALLKRMQLTSCQAHTGAEALEQLRTRPIDLIIMDMVLPDMHGLDLLTRKHQIVSVSDIPVVCCTAEANIETVEGAMALGAIDFVKKPIVIPAFSARISRAVALAPARWDSETKGHVRPRAYGRSVQPMLVIAYQVLRELDDALAMAQTTKVAVGELNALVTRARGAALNVGAARTVQQMDRLWHGRGTLEEIGELRAALVIEFAGFDDAIHAGATQPELTVLSS